MRRECSYRARLEDWVHHEGVIPEKTMEFGILDGIIGCVSAGLGISLLPRSVVAKHIQSGQLRKYSIPNRFGKVRTIFIYRKDKYIPTSLIKFIQMLCNPVESEIYWDKVGFDI